MFILRPSSPITPKPRKPKQAAAPVVIEEAKLAVTAEPTGEPYIDEGPALPDSYDVDIIRAVLQDPFRIFIYWEVRESSLKALTRYFSTEEAAGFKTALKLTEVEGGYEAFFTVGRHGRYWMTVFPEREYEFEIGARSSIHGFIPLVRSNRVRTPRGTVSPEPAQEREYKLSPPEFIEVIEAAGFDVESALDVTIRALPGALPESDDYFAETIFKLPEEVREAVIIAGGGGELTAEMIEALPEMLRSELMKLLVESDGRVASVGLMHYLPELLRETLEDERELIEESAHPLHVAPRYFAGGSENAPWPGGDVRLPRLPQKRVPGSWSPASSSSLPK
jgi:hypothetical protein